ncbi:hypothetical protein BSKO_11410 [Bryopsis sp. KO-2023]|nr:hypothetical protein BSKO_11410 [Bryopsis sp. KO-2023]
MHRATCFFPSGSSKALAYRTKQLRPQTGAPLVVFGEEFVTTRKLELVLKVETSPDEFVVKSLEGDAWFIVDRKSPQNWDQRIIRSTDGEPVCCIKKNRYPQVEGFSIWSLLTAGGEPELAIDLQDLTKGKKQKVQKMRAGLAMAENISARSFLHIEGDLQNRMYGISWTEPSKKEGPMIAMTWDVCSDGRSRERSCTKYVMEIPAGIDAAAMVAIAISVCETDAPELNTTLLPLEPQYFNQIVAFGNSFMTKTSTILILSAKADRLNVMDGAGGIKLFCDGSALFKTPDETRIFKLAEDGMSVRGFARGAWSVDVSFSKLVDGSMMHLLARIVVDCSSAGSKQAMLVASIEQGGNENIIPVRHVHVDDERRTFTLDGPVISRIVVRTMGNKQFDNWFQNARDGMACTALPSLAPDLGVGAEISPGVDIALVTAIILMTIKMAPVAKRAKSMLGAIHPFGNPAFEKSCVLADGKSKEDKLTARIHSKPSSKQEIVSIMHGQRRHSG